MIYSDHQPQDGSVPTEGRLLTTVETLAVYLKLHQQKFLPCFVIIYLKKGEQFNIMQFIEKVNINWNKISPQLQVHENKKTMIKVQFHTSHKRGCLSLPLVCVEVEVCLTKRLCHSDTKFSWKEKVVKKYFGNWANNRTAHFLVCTWLGITWRQSY